MRFCSRCGTSLSSLPPVICPACGADHYNNPRPCGEAVVVRDGRVLLMRRAERADDSWSGQWSLPGGRREPGDLDLVETALRELEEECGIRLGRDQLEQALPVRH